MSSGASASASTTTGASSTSGGASGTTGSSYTFLGCPLFGPNGWFDTDISNAPIDPNSAAYIQATVAAGDTGSFNIWAPTNEFINVATNATPLLTVQPKVSWHSFPFQLPWAASFRIETPSQSDRHALVVQKDTCHLFECYGASDDGGIFSAYSGADWDLTQPFNPQQYGGSTADASGIPMVAMLIKPEELAAGVIPHSLGWSAVGGEGLNTIDGLHFVSPAGGGGGLAYSGPAGQLPMPYGSHIRLKLSFDDSAFPAEAKMVTTALKHYGAYLFDTGCCDALGYLAGDPSGAPTWTAADGMAINTLYLHDFDVIPPSAK